MKVVKIANKKSILLAAAYKSLLSTYKRCALEHNKKAFENKCGERVEIISKVVGL